MDTTSIQPIPPIDNVLPATILVPHVQPNGINVQHVLLPTIEPSMEPYVYAPIILISSMVIKQGASSAMIT